MYAFEGSREPVERDPRNDPRRSPADPDAEVVVERTPIVADRPREEENPWPMPVERRRGERRRVERTGTDI